jgi:hypothetical protein
MHTLHGVTYNGGIVSTQVVGYMHTLDYQHTSIVLDFTADFAPEAAILGVDFARIQRASKGAQHSTAEGGDDVVDRGSVRLRQAALVDAIMLCNPTMNAEHHRLRFARQRGPA